MKDKAYAFRNTSPACISEAEKFFSLLAVRPRTALVGREKDQLRRLSLEAGAPHEDPAAKYVDLQVRSRDGVVWQNAIVLDIDDSYRDPALPRIWELIDDGVIPAPNWTCSRTETRGGRLKLVRPHLVYVLDDPVWRSSIKQSFKLDAITEQLYNSLAAHGIPVDRRQPVATKNPHSPHWTLRPVHFRRWRLDEIGEVLGIADLTQPEMRQRNRSRFRPRAGLQSFAVNGRNDQVFKDTAPRIYAMKRSGVTCVDHLVTAAIEIASEINAAFPEPLPESEVVSIGKSIGRWTAKKYTWSGDLSCDRDRGACYRNGYLTGDETRRARQSVGAQYTNHQRSNKAFCAVQKAIQTLKDAGYRTSVRAVATEAGVSATTAQKWMQTIQAGEVDEALKDDHLRAPAAAYKSLRSSVSAVPFTVPARCVSGFLSSRAQGLELDDTRARVGSGSESERSRAGRQCRPQADQPIYVAKNKTNPHIPTTEDGRASTSSRPSHRQATDSESPGFRYL